VDEWGRERGTQLTDLVDAALPGEDLSTDELVACCWDDPGVVLGDADGLGAVSACTRRHGDRTIGFVKLVAVDPDARRAGRGRALLAAAEQWAWDNDAAEVRVGAAAPFYLWPGCDVQHLAALCLFEAAGYWAVGAEVNMRVATSFRAEPPPGVTLVRALDDDVVAAMVALVRAHWPEWEAEAMRAVEHGCCHVAFRADADVEGGALGFACHSVNRAGWIGPMATDPTDQRGGVGTALLSRLCTDLRIAEMPHAEVAWVGPVSFYAKAAGASVSRVFRSLVRPKP
jgi:GNAT superfamily N-acetyltransferase